MVNIVGSYGKLKRWVNAQLHTDHQTASSESASFKDVNIALNEAYKQGTDIILRIKDLNTFLGADAGKVTTGNQNTFIGYRAGYSNIGGNFNNFIGYFAGSSNTSGYDNNFIGARAGYFNTSGYRNSFIGFQAGYKNITGYRNTFIGFRAGYFNTAGAFNNFAGYQAGYNTSGNYNSFIGFQAGYSNTSGSFNNFIGYTAGYYETGDRKLIIDNQVRANETDARIKALIYGIGAPAIANQLIRLNAILELTSIKSGSTQAATGASANEIWKTNGHATLPDNVLMIGV